MYYIIMMTLHSTYKTRVGSPKDCLRNQTYIHVIVVLYIRSYNNCQEYEWVGSHAPLLYNANCNYYVRPK